MSEIRMTRLGAQVLIASGGISEARVSGFAVQALVSPDSQGAQVTRLGVAALCAADQRDAHVSLVAVEVLVRADG